MQTSYIRIFLIKASFATSLYKSPRKKFEGSGYCIISMCMEEMLVFVDRTVNPVFNAGAFIVSYVLLSWLLLKVQLITQGLYFRCTPSNSNGMMHKHGNMLRPKIFHISALLAFLQFVIQILCQISLL